MQCFYKTSYIEKGLSQGWNSIDTDLTQSNKHGSHWLSMDGLLNRGHWPGSLGGQFHQPAASSFAGRLSNECPFLRSAGELPPPDIESEHFPL